MVEVAQFPISRLYVHVREFSPAREEKVIAMQQVTDIYGRENGWVHSAYQAENGINGVHGYDGWKDVLSVTTRLSKERFVAFFQ